MILLVKHGGPSKIPALYAAQRLDEVLVVDTDPDLFLAGVSYLPVPAMTASAICDVISRSGVRPTACLTYVDPATPVAAETASRLSLPGLAPLTATLLKHKVKMRDRLKKLGIDTPRYCMVESEEDLEKAAAAVHFPCILKPATAAYGLGVRRIDSPRVLHREFRSAAAELASGSFARFFPEAESQQWLLEEYLSGPELSIEVLGHPSTPTILAVHEKIVTEQGGHFREDRFVTAPWKLSTFQLERIREEAARLCGLLGFSRGVGNLEARLLGGGKLGVIELQTTPAGGLISKLTQRSHGIDLHEIHARSHMQWEPIELSSVHNMRACAMGVIHAERPGSFKITGSEQALASEGIFEVQVLAENGKVRDPHSEYLGFVCAEASDPLSAENLLEKALSKITVVTT